MNYNIHNSEIFSIFRAMVALGVLFIISALFAGIKTIYSVVMIIKPNVKVSYSILIVRLAY